MIGSGAAPRDPRDDWDLPVLGGMDAVADLDELTTRVLANNPSPMTLDGTNTYVVAAPGSGVAVVVDPGPDDPDHLEQVEGVLRRRDLACELVLVTHRHADHAAAAAPWAQRFGCRLAAPDPTVAGADGRVITDGDELTVGQVTLEAVATPGHTGDHTAFRAPNGALLTGDHVLGRGTSVVAHPDGDLEAYLTSLRRVLELGPDRLLPGHGPELDQDPSAVVRYYLAHRQHRLRQITDALSEGPRTPRELVERIYADVDRQLWDAAEASTRAAVAALAAQGRVEWDGKVARLP